MPSQTPGHRPRTLASLLLLAALIAALHLWVTGGILDEMAGLKPDAPHIERMKAEYVSEVRLTSPPAAPVMAPPAAAPAIPRPVAPKVPKRKPKAPEEAASAASEPEEAAKEALAAASAPSDTPPSTALAASIPASAASTASQAEAAASPTQPPSERFVWPLATKVSYVMEGNYRGPVYGQSSVEWVRQDQRYQVHIDASVGPSFAPLGSWRLSSEGEIRPEGLHPRRYENVNRLLIRSARSKVAELGDDEVTMPDGKVKPRTAGLQDPASFMIQVAYQFILDAAKAQPGSSFEMTVLTLRKPEVLVFDVVEETTLDTPMGRIPTLHVRPRKAVVEDGALPADVWFAPGLQYLPVRIEMRMKDDIWLVLKLARAPQQTPGQAPGQTPGQTAQPASSASAEASAAASAAP